MAALAESGSEAAPGARFFCTAGRGLEPFLIREVRARLEATQVEYISGKVFFTTYSDLTTMKKLKSAERLFLLIKKQLPFSASSLRKGKVLNEMQRLISDNPGSWLNAISLWKNLLEHDAEKENPSQRDANPLKRKVGRNEITIAKKLKVDEMQMGEENHGESQPEKGREDSPEPESNGWKGKQEPEIQSTMDKAFDTQNQEDLTFRVSCRCSGSVAKAFTAQEVGRVIGIALMKQFGWKADLRNPNLEIFVHLSDIYSLVGIPMFRVPLASRTYIQTAGLRSTIAWAMASTAEIKAGAFVLDPMCGLGTILVEAAKEWPDVYYVGADVSDSQLLGACDNLNAAGLKDRIELLKVSVTELPWPSESVDIIISDIPFGKKFKLGKDIKSILQEMERVLHVGGTMVLLLSEAHHRCLRSLGDGSIPLSSEGSHTTDLEMKTFLNPDKATDSPEAVSSTHEAGTQPCADKMSPFGSLVPVECFRVSLGKTDAFICKYKKAQASGLPLTGCGEPSNSL
uniref:U6 snRNA (guanine-N(2))-methyltransferase THUMPD2 n=1 Tax=Nannospalax galili TaxID=1026970 RepID=A0A8C6RAF1_NANGA